MSGGAGVRMRWVILSFVVACGRDGRDSTGTSDDSAADDSGVVDGDGDGWFAPDDCDDGNEAVHPAATEICNAIDDDCDGGTDEDAMSQWFADHDGDGFGDDSETVKACAPPADSDWVVVGDDCDDASPTIHPDAAEVCDDANTDEDCDGAVDDADDSVTGQGTYYTDADNDDFGVLPIVLACDQPAGTAGGDTDCDDANPERNPAPPRCVAAATRIATG